MSETFRFELGQDVIEKITGFSGIIMGRTEYITGCRQYGVCPRGLKKDTGGMPDWAWLDEERLQELGTKITLSESIGGPQPTAPSR